VRSKALEDVQCPKCKCKGQLKLDSGRYFRVDHYKARAGFPHGTWIRSCYISQALAKANGFDNLKDKERGPLIIPRRPSDVGM
jgi:hypothetical protein